MHLNDKRFWTESKCVISLWIYSRQKLTDLCNVCRYNYFANRQVEGCVTWHIFIQHILLLNRYKIFVRNRNIIDRLNCCGLFERIMTVCPNVSYENKSWRVRVLTGSRQIVQRLLRFRFFVFQRNRSTRRYITQLSCETVMKLYIH